METKDWSAHDCTSPGSVHRRPRSRLPPWFFSHPRGQPRRTAAALTPPATAQGCSALGACGAPLTSGGWRPAHGGTLPPRSAALCPPAPCSWRPVRRSPGPVPGNLPVRTERPAEDSCSRPVMIPAQRQRRWPTERQRCLFPRCLFRSVHFLSFLFFSFPRS